MRHRIAFFALAAAALACPSTSNPLALNASAVAAAADSSPQLVINGTVIQGDTPFYRGGGSGVVLFAPARLVLEALGYTVAWKPEEQMLQAALQESVLTHKPGSTIWTVDDHPFVFTDSSITRDGTLWIPVQPLAEALGQELKWSSLTSTLYMKSSFSVSIQETLGYGYTRLSYEGDTVEGLRHGDGKLYLDGKLWYEGSFSRNKLSGGGRLYTNGQLRYEGGFSNDQPQGRAKLYLADGSIYDGEFRNGHQSGEGVLLDAIGRPRYHGDWVNGLMEGSGDIYDDKGLIVYSGEMKQNRQQGYGVAFIEAKNLTDGSPTDGQNNSQNKAKTVRVYDGQWEDNLRSGNGKSYDDQGKLEYIGSWSKDKKDGSGYAYKLSKLEWIIKNDKGEQIRDPKETTEMREVRYRNGILLEQGNRYLYIGDKLSDGTPHGSGIMHVETQTRTATSQGAANKSVPYYDGEFEQGRLTGTGKLYDNKGQLVYEGKVTDGKRNGRGKSYENGVLAYEGEWSADQMSGLGRRYTYDKSYTGKDFNGSSSLLMYEGRFAAGKETEPIAVYRQYGLFQNGLADGYGAVMLLHDYKNESGPKSLDKQQGPAWLIYEGEFSKGLREGQGRLYENNTLVYEGEFSKGLRQGQGSAYENGLVYIGPYRDDLKEGEGSMYDAFQTLRFKGTFKNGKKNGFGRLYTENGVLSYEGQFQNDWKHGYGKLFGSDGKTPYYQGEFREDKTLSQYLDDMKEKP